MIINNKSIRLPVELGHLGLQLGHGRLVHAAAPLQARHVGVEVVPGVLGGLFGTPADEVSVCVKCW